MKTKEKPVTHKVTVYERETAVILAKVRELRKTEPAATLQDAIRAILIAHGRAKKKDFRTVTVKG